MKRKPKATKSTARNTDAYLGKVSDEQRVALKKLRAAIKAAAPQAEECISYQMPAFRLNGKFLVSFAAWANHCAFYAGSHPIEVHQDALKSYDTHKGTLRFPTNKPLPATLVRKLVKARIAQIAS